MNINAGLRQPAAGRVAKDEDLSKFISVTIRHMPHRYHDDNGVTTASHGEKDFTALSKGELRRSADT